MTRGRLACAARVPERQVITVFPHESKQVPLRDNPGVPAKPAQVHLILDTLGERGRCLFEARLEISGKFPGFGEILGLALFQCQRGGLFEVRLARLKARFTDRNLVTSAELCREFRNFLFHGEDQSPSHEDWGSASVSRCRLYRFYTISRLLLFLIQALAWIGLTDDITLTPEDDDAPVPCRTVLATLHFQELAH